MKILHVVPGLDEPWNGIAVAARLIAVDQAAAITDARCMREEQIAGADEIWVHSMWTPPVWRACRKTLKQRKRLVRMIHANLDPARLAYHGWKKRFVGAIERFYLRRADATVATCAAEVEWIRAYEPHVKDVLRVDLKRFFRIPGCPAKVPQREVSGSRPLHVLYLGRRHPLKGIEFLEEAVRRLSISRSLSTVSIELRIVSDAFGEAKEAAWNWCDVFVLPTLSENFGLVVAEALEHGKYVITTDGAPAWGEGNDRFGGRLTYLVGYRDGTDEERIGLLTKAIEQMIWV